MDASDVKKLIELEGDYKEFEYEGFECVIRRIPNMGHLCGYIEISDMKPIPIDTIEEEIQTHGTITYKGSLEHLDKEGFWIGFDCGHFRDYIPEVHGSLNESWDWLEYRTMEYVENILMYMVGQLQFLKRRTDNGYRIEDRRKNI